MTTQLASAAPGAAIAALRARLGAAAPVWADALSQQSSPPRLSLLGSRFSVMAAGERVRQLETLYADVVMVGGLGTVARQYFAKAYDADEPSGPDCWSSNGLAPDADATNRMAPSCSGCQFDQAGSHSSGRGKACGSLTRIVVVLTDTGEALYQPLSLDIKAMSLFGDSFPDERKYNFLKYVQTLAASGRQPHEVITRISFDPNASVPKLLFQPVAELSEQYIERILPYFEGRKSEVEGMASLRGKRPVAPALAAPPARVALPPAAPAQAAPAQAAPAPATPPPAAFAPLPPLSPPVDAVFTPPPHIAKDYPPAASTLPAAVVAAPGAETPMDPNIREFLETLAR